VRLVSKETGDIGTYLPKQQGLHDEGTITGRWNDGNEVTLMIAEREGSGGDIQATITADENITMRNV